LRRAMKPTARLILVELVIPEGAAFHFGKWTDLQMLVCIGGRERTETEYRGLLSGAGFDLQEVVSTDSPLSLLVAKPKQTQDPTTLDEPKYRFQEAICMSYASRTARSPNTLDNGQNFVRARQRRTQ
jgi:O-methyltransferase domain